MFGWLFRRTPPVEVLCLANSRKYQGRCFAGLVLDGSGWIRPVSRDKRSHGALKESLTRLPDGSSAQVLDIIALKVSKPCPLPFQQENWYLARGKWKLTARRISMDDLEAFVAPGPSLLGSTVGILEPRHLATLKEVLSRACSRYCEVEPCAVDPRMKQCWPFLNT